MQPQGGIGYVTYACRSVELVLTGNKPSGGTTEIHKRTRKKDLLQESLSSSFNFGNTIFEKPLVVCVTLRGLAWTVKLLVSESVSSDDV